MSVTARKPPKFPWDYEVPNTTFWNSLDYKVGRNFLQCHTESEISQMTFNETLSLEEKLKYLRSILNQTLSAKSKKTAPIPLHDVDYKSWNHLKLGLSTIEHFLGDYDAEEKIVREMYESGPDGTKSMSALHQLSGLMEKVGRYGEAETMAREVLPWMQGHEMLGGNSPQALGCMRVLVRSIWKQTRYVEAGEWIEKCKRTVENMGKGHFAKFQDDERRQLDDDVKALKKWREEHEAK
jgi:hypothetical protein